MEYMENSKSRQLALFYRTQFLDLCFIFKICYDSITFIFFKNSFLFSACWFNRILFPFRGYNILPEDIYYSFLKYISGRIFIISFQKVLPCPLYYLFFLHLLFLLPPLFKNFVLESLVLVSSLPETSGVLCLIRVLVKFSKADRQLCCEQVGGLWASCQQHWLASQLLHWGSFSDSQI